VVAGEASGDGKVGFRARAGALTLFYLCSPLDREMLLALFAEATTGARVTDGSIALPSEKAQIDSVFADRYLIEPADPNLDPDDVDAHTPMQPTPAGREVPFVATTLQRWLRRCPSGPMLLDDDAAGAVLPLITGWGSAVTHTLAGGPLSTAEACEALQVLPLDLVEALIEGLEEAGQVEALPATGDDGDPCYAVTDWLRMGIAPLAAAARMEQRHPPGDTAPISTLDVEAAFKLTLPLLKLPRGLDGACALTVELEEGVLGSPSSVTARIEERRVVSVAAEREEDADAWATGPAAAWLDAVIDRDTSGIETGGDPRLAGAMLKALNRKLF
jgi:hypothetical protein